MITFDIVVDLVIEIVGVDIEFRASSTNTTATIKSLVVRFVFYNFTFSIARDASAEVARKALFYLYSKSVSSFALRDRRTGAIVVL